MKRCVPILCRRGVQEHTIVRKFSREGCLWVNAVAKDKVQAIATNRKCLSPQILLGFVELALRMGVFKYPTSGYPRSGSPSPRASRPFRVAKPTDDRRVALPSKYRLPHKFEHLLKNGRRYCYHCVLAAIKNGTMEKFAAPPSSCWSENAEALQEHLKSCTNKN